MTPADDPGELLTGGGLARATGLTVRTLHHYDRLGLLSPLRDAGGRRRYGPAEARRLHQIIALRGFGLPLAEIARLFEGQGTGSAAAAAAAAGPGRGEDRRGAAAAALAAGGNQRPDLARWRGDGISARRTH